MASNDARKPLRRAKNRVWPLTWCYAQLWCSSASSTPSWSGCPAGWYSWCEMTPPRTQRSSCSDTRWQSRGGKSPARKPDWADRDRRLGEASTQPVPCPRRGFPMRSVNWSVGGPTATERYLLAGCSTSRRGDAGRVPSAYEERPKAHAEYRPSASSDTPDRRLRERAASAASSAG